MEKKTTARSSITAIVAGMSAAAISAAMIAMPAAASETSESYADDPVPDTASYTEDLDSPAPAPDDGADDGYVAKTIYAIGFNIQFGNFYGGTFTATAEGSNVLGIEADEDGYPACTGEKTYIQNMWAVNDWSSTVENEFADGIAIADGTYTADNPGWNGMWIQCYVDDLSNGLEITFEIDAQDGTWMNMDPADEDFSGWTVLRPMIDGYDAFVHTEAAEGTTQPSEKSFEFTLSLSGAYLDNAFESKSTKPLIGEEVIYVPDDTSSDVTESTGDSSSENESDDSEDDSSSVDVPEDNFFFPEGICYEEALKTLESYEDLYYEISTGFDNNTEIKLYFDSYSKTYLKVYNGWLYAEIDGKATIYGYMGDSNPAVIPEKIGDTPVTKISVMHGVETTSFDSDGNYSGVHGMSGGLNTLITPYTYSDTDDVLDLVIPSTVTDIEYLYAADYLNFICEEGSPAAKYFKENDIEYTKYEDYDFPAESSSASSGSASSASNGNAASSNKSDSNPSTGVAAGAGLLLASLGAVTLVKSRDGKQ